MTDPEAALRVLAALRRSPVGDSAVLVGSSGLFGFETEAPALTEDIDVAIPEPLASRYGREIIESLRREGFAHEPGTATFIGQDGTAFDLLGHGDPAERDHVGGGEALRVMVFEDLSRLLGDESSTSGLSNGGRALTPAAFVASKLLTERAHKGNKDKLQALLVLAERSDDQPFADDVRRFLETLGGERMDDVRASAMNAFLALERDPTFTDAGAEGYFPLLEQVQKGLRRLLALLESTHG